MGAIRKAAIFPFVIIILMMTYILFRGFYSWKQGYSWSEMDWDKSGSTSIVEFLKSSDIGKRSIQTNDQKCTEYFSYKDGLPIKTICPQ